MWPKTINQLAAEWSCDADTLRGDLERLGVRLVDVASQVLISPRDLDLTLFAPGATTIRSSKRADHVERLLDIFRTQGCDIETAKLGEKRARNVYQLTSREADGCPTVLKIQVCNTEQRGGWVNFNLDTEILRDGPLEWIVAVAPSFTRNTDFIVRRHDAWQMAQESGYGEKPSFPFRLKEQITQYDFAAHLRQVILSIHGSE